MSKPSIASKLTGAFKRVFGKTTRPVVSSKPEDMAAGDAAVQDPDAPTETTPADAAAPDAAGEFATEAASSQEQQPVETPASPEAAEAPAAPGTEPAEPAADEADLVKPEEKAEIVETLNVAEAETVAASTKAFVEARAATGSGSAAGAGEPPLPNYDTLTLPSVRARLRKLTIEQVRELRAYESANANRPEFVRMYDNRVAKLEAETSE